MIGRSNVKMRRCLSKLKADRLLKKEDHEDLYKHLIVVVLGRGSQDGRQNYDIDPMLLSPNQY